ncbi:DUF917 domain-containing protein [Desulfurispora thermophila]|uniref:DUF917 domain-containing protein n=1 Tax=Desulfurispora thermophila TaxID=265470 RepID=UPI00036FF471|nr:DUF917 domain-containing protein [Desulfurispora thermophila]
MKKLTKQDLYDILYGCTILGTGGGGDLAEGLAMIDDALAKGKEFNLVSLDEVPDDAYIATPYMCGAVSPAVGEGEAPPDPWPTIDEEPCLKAFRAMEKYMGREFYGVISTELGGGNTAIAFYVAALAGKYIIDADPAGRSVPELQHSTYYIHGLPIAPIAVANHFGDVAILTEVVDDLRAEALVRAMAVASKNHIGVVDHPARAGVLKKAVIPGAISCALKLGQAFREAREQGRDLAGALCRAGNGVVLFRGTVRDFGWDTVDGFTVGETFLEGSGEYAGSTYKVWFKNEHIIAWRNGEIDVTVPDLICMVCDDTGEPITNPNYRVGMRVSVFALPAPAQWRTEKGLQCFGPKHFGYNIDYIPVEKKFARAE